MKKILCMIMAVIMIMSLVACGNKTPEVTDPVDTPTQNIENSTDVNTNNENPTDNSETVGDPIDPNVFTYAEELTVALISQTGSVAPVATERLNLENASEIISTTGLEDITKIKNVAVATSVDETKVFKLIMVIFNDEQSATNSVETLKNTLSSLADSCAAVSTKNYAIAVVMNAGDSDAVSAQGVCDKFVEMMADEASIYFPTRHLDEEPPVIDDTSTEEVPTEEEAVVSDESVTENPTEDTSNSDTTTEG